MEADLDEKYPKVARSWKYFKEVWEETFPDPDKKMKSRMQARRDIAKQ